MRATIAASAIALALLAWYPMSCWLHPLRDCWCCKGKGVHRPVDSNGKPRRIARPCRWCRQTGKRIRIGRRIWNRAREKSRPA